MPTPPAGKGGITGDGKVPEDYSGLTDAQRNAYTLVVNTLTEYGLAGLASYVLSYVKEGYSADTIALKLQDTNEWKQRFAGNEARKKAGLSVLPPAEYIATERSYAAVMHAAGVPTGFYDQPSDFAGFIAKDVSASELNDRVKAATDFVNRQDPAQLKYFRDHYGQGDLIAYALDPDKAAPLIAKRFAAATIGGAGMDAKVGVSATMAEKLAEAGVSLDQARSGFGSLGLQQSTLAKLAAISGTKQLTADDLAAGMFLHQAAVTDAIGRLASGESSRFAGSSGLGQSSLSKSTGGI